jgi:nitrogen regulatory protein PII
VLDRRLGCRARSGACRRVVVDAIASAARTGRDGDGTIVVVPVEEVVHISYTAAVA